MIQQIFSVVVVFGLLAAALWLLRSRGLARFRGLGGRKTNQHLEAIARLPLTAQHSVHLVRVSDHAIVVGLSPSGCTLLERVDWSPAEKIQMAQPVPGAVR